MNHVRTVFLLLPFLFLPARAKAQDIRAKADSIAKAILKQKHVPGLQIGIVSDGRTQVFSYGETIKGNGIRPDTNSIYELGSLTQVFTASLYAGMLADTLIHSDDPLQMYLPAGVKVPVRQNIVCKPGMDINTSNPDKREIHLTPYTCFPDPASRPLDILLCDLATHSSGLPAKPENLHKIKDQPNIYADYQTQDLYQWLSNAPLIAEEFPEYHGSDAGMALLGQALMAKTGLTYDELLQKRLLNRLHMNTTKCDLLKSEAERHLNGYSAKGYFIPKWRSEAMAPAAGLHSNMTDLLTFLQANIGGNGKPVLPALEYTHAPRTSILQQKKTVEEIGLGWRIKPEVNNRYKLHWQEGSTAGFSAYMGFIETSGVGIVILCNSPVKLDQAGETLLRALYKAPAGE